MHFVRIQYDATYDEEDWQAMVNYGRTVGFAGDDQAVVKALLREKGILAISKAREYRDDQQSSNGMDGQK